MEKPDRGDMARGESPGREVAQATLRPRSVLECERAIRLAHESGLATATAYRGPDGGDYPAFVMLVDEEGKIERFLPELYAELPGTPVSVSREEVVHAAPEDFLSGGAYRPRPFRVGAPQVGLVFAGGALGAGARLLLEEGSRRVSPASEVFPWGTMAVNVAGSFAIAVLGALLFERFLGERERMFWVLGFLGSFTTFSSYALQTTETWAASPFLGALYGGGSMFLGLFAALAGIRLARGAL